MKAYVIAPFDGAPDGEIYPRRFNTGEEVFGELAVIAVREGWAAEHSLDHDGDGKAGGSKPKGGKKAKEA